MLKIFPLVVPEDMNKPRTVFVQADTVVLPRSEAIITGRVAQGFGVQVEGMLDPSPSISDHCDVMVARVVCKVEQITLPVRVINVTEEALTLREGMKVSTLYPDIEVSSGGEYGGGQIMKMSACPNLGMWSPC